MQMCKMSNCAVQDIDGLSRHGSGEEAMAEFCRLNFSDNGVRFGGGVGKRGTLYSFYIFSQPVGEGYYARNYGFDFAKFIKENKLGRVWKSSLRKNYAFHADHHNVVWVWSPVTNKVSKWWEEYKAREKAKEAEAQAQLKKLQDAAKVDGLNVAVNW